MITELKETRFSVNQVASACDVHAGTVWRWIQRGAKGRKLAAFRIGGRTYIAARALREFMDSPQPASESKEPSGGALEAGRQLDDLGIGS
ncbi:DUF1580 domain-containing protein [bacterium]|nr:DUF1580 domain-containing protein [bacterium]